MIMESDFRLVECKTCGYKWNYRGKSVYYASCPRCLYKVSVKPKEEKKDES